MIGCGDLTKLAHHGALRVLLGRVELAFVELVDDCEGVLHAAAVLGLCLLQRFVLGVPTFEVFNSDDRNFDSLFLYRFSYSSLC